MTIPVDVAKVRITTDGVSAGPYGLTGGGGALYATSAANLVVTHVPTSTGMAAILASGADYTIGGDITTGAGTITTTAVRAAGVLTVRRATPRLQASTWREGDGNPSARFESTSDLGRLIDQEAVEMVARAIKAPDYEAPLDLTLQPVATRQGKAAVFDSTGKLVASALSETQLESLLAIDVPTLTALVAQATAADTDIGLKLTIIESYGAHKGVNNIFDLMPTAIVTGIINRSGSGVTGFLDTYFSAAVAAGGTWFLPAGEYHLDLTITLAPGVEFWGASQDLTNGTVVFLGGTSGSWGMELLNANGTAKIEGPKFRDIGFQVTNRGIRWNSATGGFDDTSGTQDYMMQPRIQRCSFSMDSGTQRQCIQMNKCFDFVIEDCRFSSFTIDIELNGCDDGRISNNRSDTNQDCCLLATAQGTFGNLLEYRGNDLNTAKNNFVRSTYRGIAIIGNHMELDGSPGSTGSGGNMPAAIDISGGEAFEVRIHDNSMEMNFFADNWLRVAPTVNNYLLSAFNNVTASSPAAMGHVAFTSAQPYFDNSAGTCIIRHGGNGGLGGFPFNSCNDDVRPSGGDVVFWTPGRRGLVQQGGFNPGCVLGDMALPVDGSGNSVIQISDFELPVTGTLDIWLQAYGGAAGQQVQVDILDNGVSITGGFQNITLAVNKINSVAIAAANVVATALSVRLRNIDTARNTTVWIRSVSGRQH